MKITVFTKNGCPKCRMTEMRFKNSNIPFNEINIDEQPEYLQKLKEQGFMRMPVVFAEEKTWSDLDIKQIDLTIEEYKQSHQLSEEKINIAM